MLTGAPTVTPTVVWAPEVPPGPQRHMLQPMVLPPPAEARYSFILLSQERQMWVSFLPKEITPKLPSLKLEPMTNKVPDVFTPLQHSKPTERWCPTHTPHTPHTRAHTHTHTHTQFGEVICQSVCLVCMCQTLCTVLFQS